jgi:hypothetical protein
VLSHAVVARHVKFLAACTPAPCILKVTGAVRIGARRYAVKPVTVLAATTATRTVNVPLSRRAVRAVRRALRRHRAVRMAVQVDTLDAKGERSDRDALSWRLRRVLAG